MISAHEARGTGVDHATHLLYKFLMTSRELKRWLQKQGGTFEPGKGGHLLVRRSDRKSVLPMHGSKHDLPKGTVQAIRKQLGFR